MMNNRNWGIEGMKVFSMLLIVILHIFIHSDLILSPTPTVLEKNVYYLGQSICMCGVNCYAIITGYLCLDSKFRISRILNLWLIVLFYSVGIMLIDLICGSYGLDAEDILTCIFPMSMIHYWYFTEYFRLFVIIPILNFVVNKLSKKQLLVVLISLLLLGLCMASYIQHGYHFVWLAILYLFGAYIKRYPIQLNKVKKIILVFLYVGAIVLTWLQVSDVIQLFGVRLLQYTSPTIFTVALILLILFSQLQVPNRIRNVVGWMAKRSFAVYLIHTHMVIWDLIIANSLVAFNSQTMGVKGLIASSIVVMIFMCGCVIDECRERLWKRLRIQERLNGLDNYLSDNVSEIPLFIKLKQVLDVKDGERHDME
ncbi:MAG: acyltransferase [Lachnospiraceae bacterium]|nr:acyltransferase [Lachnospiraceae bacterium]